MASVTLEDLAKIRAAKMENRRRQITLGRQVGMQQLDAQTQADLQEEQLSYLEDLAKARMAHDEKVRKETQRTKEKAQAKVEREPGLGESGNPEPILEPPQPMNPQQPNAGPTLNPTMMNNYGQPGGPQPGSPLQSSGSSVSQAYGGPPVDPFLMSTQATEGRRELLPGVLIPDREVTTTIKPNVLSAYEGATLGQQQLETMSRVRAEEARLQLQRNKTFITSFKDLAPEVGPELASRISQASADGDMDTVLGLSQMIPDTNTGRLIKQKIRSETARQAASYASASASRASATNSYASAGATQDKRLDTLLSPLAQARAHREALTEAQRVVLDKQVEALPAPLRARLDQLEVGTASTPLSTVGKTAADLGVSLPEMPEADRIALVKQTADRSTKIDLGMRPTTEAKVEETQLQVSRARDSLDRTRALLTNDMLGLSGRTANSLVRFAKDKAALPLVPSAAQLGAQFILGKSKAELDAWDRQRAAAFSNAGRETAYVINDLFGTAVNEREDKRAQQFVNELQSGDADRIMAVLGEAQVYANMKLASYSLWNKKGKVGRPWDIPDSRVAEALYMEFNQKTQEFLNKGATENVARAAAQMKLEREYGLSNGMAATLMREYGYGR